MSLKIWTHASLLKVIVVLVFVIDGQKCFYIDVPVYGPEQSPERCWDVVYQFHVILSLLSVSYYLTGMLLYLHLYCQSVQHLHFGLTLSRARLVQHIHLHLIICRTHIQIMLMRIFKTLLFFPHFGVKLLFHIGTDFL